MSATPIFDIYLYVYTTYASTKESLDSILRQEQSIDFRLSLVELTNDDHIHDLLRRTESSYPFVNITKSIPEPCTNESLSAAPFLVFIASGVIANKGWLANILSAIRDKPEIGIFTPLSNASLPTYLEILPALNYRSMSELLSKLNPPAKSLHNGSYPVIVYRTNHYKSRPNSLLQTKLLSPCPFTEKSAMLLNNQYIYHSNNISACEESFLSRSTSSYRLIKNELQLVYGPNCLDYATSLQSELWHWGRKVIAAWKKSNLLMALKNSATACIRIPNAKRALPSEGLKAYIESSSRLSVTYIVEKLLISGGILSIIQLVNELTKLGVDARIATLFMDPTIHLWKPIHTTPLIFRSWDELLEKLPSTDIAVATLWSTAPVVHQLFTSNRCKETAYFLQDYEPWFVKSNQQGQSIISYYSKIRHRIVKSDWLQSKLDDLGLHSTKVPLGLDLGVFYPRNRQHATKTVLAMARPGTPRRDFPNTIKALSIVKKTNPEVNIVLFGDNNLSNQDIPFEYEDKKIIDDQQELAELYSNSDVFLDGSHFQGFGRCGLEAMACGCSCVLTNVGGVNEYATDQVNCYLVPPESPDHFAQAINSLMDDEILRAQFIANGLKAAANYCLTKEATNTLQLFKTLVPPTQASHKSA